MTDHHHGHSHEEERKIRKTILATINRDYSEHFHDHDGHHHDHDSKEKQNPHASNLLENPDNVTQLTQPMMGKHDNEDDEDEEAFKNVTRTANKVAKKMSFVQNVKKSVALDRIFQFFLLLISCVFL